MQQKGTDMILKDEDRKALTEEFQALTQPVKMILFTQELNCEYCNDTKAILTEVAELSDHITVEEVPLLLDGDTAGRYSIDKAPAIVVTDEAGTPSGVTFYGIPSGYEFVSLLGAIKDQGTGKLELPEDVQKQAMAIDSPVNLKVFVTPTCPYCPRSVRFAHQLAKLNSNITAEMIEASEFPEMARKYQVMGVPRTVINEDHHYEGAFPEAMAINEVYKAIGKEAVA